MTHPDADFDFDLDDARSLLAGLGDAAPSHQLRSALYDLELRLDACLGDTLLPPNAPAAVTDPAATFDRLHRLLAHIADAAHVDGFEVALCRSGISYAETLWGTR